MDDETTTDEQAYSSGEEVGRDHIPTVNLRQSWWKSLTEDRPATSEPALTIPSSDLPVPTHIWASALQTTYVPLPENSLLAQTGDIATFMDWYCKRQGISELSPKDLEGPAYEIVKVFHPDVVHLQFQMEECHKLITDKVDDAILKYNVSKPLPLGGEPGDRRAVRTYMCILSVVRIEVFSMYGYNYMQKIILRRADLKEYVIAERDFKYMYPSDFEDLYLLNLQGHLNHLSPDDKKVLTTAVNLWTRNLVIRQCVEDFQLGIENSPRAVTFRDKYGVQMIMRFNEIHKFSDGTLQQIDEALDYRVKEFRVNRTNPGMNTRFWTKKDVAPPYVLNLFEMIDAHIKGFDSNEEELVPKVDDVSLVDGAFGGDGEEDFVMGEGVVVSYFSLDRSTKCCLGGIMVSLIFLEGLEEEACVDAIEVEEKRSEEDDCEDDKDGEGDDYLFWR
ncbi:hypothetical protein Tco_0116085 [Tanacetum coccineum]